MKLLGAALIALALCGAGAAVASDKRPDAVVLAASLVAEAGWTATTDHQAMLHVLGRRASTAGVSVADMARQYCAAWKRPTAPRTRWLAGLNAAGRRPAGWPHNARWERRIERYWRIVLHDARTFLARPSRVPDPCGSCEPDHFGGSMDVARVPSSWRRCDCGQTFQRYWRAK